MQQQSRPPSATPTLEQVFGAVLRDVRKHRGFSQEGLAFESGYHPTYISQLERGKKSASLKTIMRLAAALKTSGSGILRRVETRLHQRTTTR